MGTLVEKIGMDIPVITKDKFFEHMEDDDFSFRFGDPVAVSTANGQEYVCMSKEIYDGTVDLSDECDYEVKYWIYELAFTEKAEKMLDSACEIARMSREEFIYDAIWQTVRMGKKDPEGLKKIHEEYLAKRRDTEEDDYEIIITRSYPVYWNETETEAYDRCLREEMEALEKKACRVVDKRRTG